MEKVMSAKAAQDVSNLSPFLSPFALLPAPSSEPCLRKLVRPTLETTYEPDDGDISSATAPSVSHRQPALVPYPHAHPHPRHLNSQRSTDTTTDSPHTSPDINNASPASRHPGHGGGDAPPAWAAAPQGFLSNMTPKEIQGHILHAIEGDPGRAYKIKEPPRDRPVRIYADGVYDLLHYGHMLQLRQCALAFPSTYLLVGVCSDELVRRYKASPVLTSAERYESVRHCKWVDEVVEDAPWVVTKEFLEQHRIDYVAHDEEPYVSAGSEDVYAYAKSIGAFLPTKRTNGVSTSELLQRIVEVSGYREGDYDSKFIKLGLPELCSTRAGSEAGTSGSKVEALTVDGTARGDSGMQEQDQEAEAERGQETEREENAGEDIE
ncbi:choline-phosphate cytidylyltransferase, partial [Phenoliferia sp. Uapishka_3]